MSKATKADTPQKVNYNDAVAESKKYFDGDDLAATVWVSKYALKDSFGNIYEKSPREMHERIASEIERIEQNTRTRSRRRRFSRCSTISVTSFRRAAR